MAWRPTGHLVTGVRPTMKNFGRLLRFAWPYRVRFGALARLRGARRGDVGQELRRGLSAPADPLPQPELPALDRRSRRIDRRPRSVVSEARLERDRLPRLPPRADRPGPAARTSRPWSRSVRPKSSSQRKLQEEQLDAAHTDRRPGARPPSAAVVRPTRGHPPRVADPSAPRRRGADRRALQGHELFQARRPISARLPAARRGPAERLDDATWWHGKYVRVQPWINRYLPHNGFNTLLLLLGAGDGRRRAEGVLPVPPGSARRRHDPAHPLRHPQPLLPEDAGPRPRQLQRAGLGRPARPVHERHGVAQPGPEHHPRQGDPRAAPDRRAA